MDGWMDGWDGMGRDVWLSVWLAGWMIYCTVQFVSSTGESQKNETGREVDSLVCVNSLQII